jgi:hypothetical protein
MSDIISRGMALLAEANGLSAMESETESPEEDAAVSHDAREEEILQQLVALTQLLLDRVDALCEAMCAPRERIPVRDGMGRIISVTDVMVMPMHSMGPDEEMGEYA